MEKIDSDLGSRSQPVYSICVTTKNAIETVERSLESILSQLDDRFEVIVVDGGSTDGTTETILRLQGKYPSLAVVRKRSSRGLGRDTAYRMSKGRYLIQQVDSDVIYRSTLRSILDYYHSMERLHDGNYAVYVDKAYLICLKRHMDAIGGWPDLQFAEDLYVYARLSRICSFEYNRSLSNSAVREHVRTHEGISHPGALIKGAYSDYVIWRDLHRVLPLMKAVGLLRLYVAWAARGFLRKSGHAVMFVVGTLAQYLRARYKLRGQTLNYYTDVILRYYFWEEEDLKRR